MMTASVCCCLFVVSEHTGSPIRIRVLLPKRAFDLHTEANVSGSIIKQYKLECERADKLREAKEAREAALAAEAKAKENSSSRSSEADAQMADAEHLGAPGPAAAAAAAGAPQQAQQQQAPAQQPPQQGGGGNAAASSLASVAPLPEVSGGVEEADLKTTIEMYENLRPVWHGQSKQGETALGRPQAKCVCALDDRASGLTCTCTCFCSVLLSDGMNAYVLHFDHHRVREKSVKNFRIVRTVPDPTSKVPNATVQKTVLQFGRVLDRNVFVMDYAYPLSSVSLRAIARILVAAYMSTRGAH